MIKKITLLTAIVSMTFAPSLWAQDDDMYFVPKKKTAEEKAQEAKAKVERNRHYIGNTYYVGSNRNVDEYNRRRLKSSVMDVSSDTTNIGSDIISFSAGDGSYPDSLTISKMDSVSDYSVYNPDEYSDDDYIYSRRIGRWYAYADPWYSHRWYYDPWYWNCWGFYDPWVYSYCWSGYYDPYYWGPWYGSWYYDDPWFYGAGWYGYPGYWGGMGYYGGGGHGGYGGRVYAGGVAGTQGHGNVSPRNYAYSTSASRGGNAYARGNSYSGNGRNAVARTTHAVSRGVSSVSRTDNTSTMRTAARTGSLSGYRANSYSNNNYSTSRSANSNNYSSNNSSRSSNTSSYSPSSSSSGGGFSGGRSGGGGGGGRSGGGFGGRR